MKFIFNWFKELFVKKTKTLSNLERSLMANAELYIRYGDYNDRKPKQT